LKFQAIAKKTAKNFRGILFAAPCSFLRWEPTTIEMQTTDVHVTVKVMD